MSSLYGRHLELPWDAEIAPATFEVAIISFSIGGTVCLDTGPADRHSKRWWQADANIYSGGEVYHGEAILRRFRLCKCAGSA